MRREWKKSPGFPGTPSRPIRWRDPVLVLDGDARSAHQITEVLVNAGLEVEAVHTAEDLLERMSSAPSTVLVVNVPVPGMSESVLLSLTSRVTGSKVMPIVLASHIYSEDSSVAKSLLDKGAIDFVGRPAASARWRSALEAALSELQTESAKLASLKQGRDAASMGHPTPADSSGAGSFRTGGGMDSMSSPFGDAAFESPPKGGRAVEVLSLNQRMELEHHGFLVPEQALAAELLGGGTWAGSMLLWSAEPERVSLACVGHDLEIDAELRLGFRFSVDGTPHQPRLLVRVAGSTRYPWGALVELHVIGAAPGPDFEALLTLQEDVGLWSLEPDMDDLVFS